MSPHHEAPVSRRWRKHLRISVLGLMVIVLVIGVGLGWLVRSARIQRDAVAAIKRKGLSPTVRYSWEWKDGQEITGGAPWAPRWLVDRLGVDYFGHVTMLRSWGLSNSDPALAEIGRLASLEELHLSGMHVEWNRRRRSGASE